MDNRGNQNRAFLFLQGPNGPFFAHLAKMLHATGADKERTNLDLLRNVRANHPDAIILLNLIQM